MVISLFNIFKDFHNYQNLNSGDKLLFWVEISLVFVTLLVLFIFILTSSVHKKIVLVGAASLIAVMISLMLEMYLLACTMTLLFCWVMGVIVVLYTNNLKRKVDGIFKLNRSGYAISQEDKDTLIATLVKTSEYLAKRKVGALIVIESEDNLNSIIEKAISIEGNVTQELLTTIFTEGTACHDGAVIIRANKIMCAAAYLPSTDKYDLPKSLGTRHRAAIGLSERYDAFTIVVSEETGNLSYTIDGNIHQNISVDELTSELNNFIKVAK